MLTRFEHFAVTEMMGEPETPPRANGSLCFSHDWERTAFGVALALARQGHFEWDDFRDELISEVIVPPQAGRPAAYMKVTTRARSA